MLIEEYEASLRLKLLTPRGQNEIIGLRCILLGRPTTGYLAATMVDDLVIRAKQTVGPTGKMKTPHGLPSNWTITFIPD